MSVKVKSVFCKGCDICVDICPKDVLELSPERNEKGYNVAQVVKPEECIKCKKCEINCPDLAISVKDE